ncbi:MAG: tetratricopeptide repeat protein, partial [Thermoguttaceae bacterium]
RSMASGNINRSGAGMKRFYANFSCRSVNTMRKYICFVIVVLFFTTGSLRAVKAQESTSSQNTKADIQKLVEQLGDEDFTTREDAHAKLRKVGISAINELQKAASNPDIEVSERAKELLKYIELSWITAKDHPIIRNQMQRYAASERSAEKIGIIIELSDWSGQQGLTDAQGVTALCRILKYEQDPLVRAEAAKVMLATPPVRFKTREKWFKSILDSLSNTSDDLLTDLVVDFIEIRQKAIEYRDDVLFQENPEPANEKLIKDIRELGRDIQNFRSKNEYFEGRRGTDIDILLFYALAEVQEAVGLTDELNETVSQALAVTPIHTDEGISPYISHYMAALYLNKRHFVEWAKNEFILIANKEPRLKPTSFLCVAEAFSGTDKNKEAAEYYGYCVDVLNNPKKNEMDFFVGDVNKIKSRYECLLAQIAFDEGDYDKAKEHLIASSQMQSDGVDCIILRYKLGKILTQEKKENDDGFNQNTTNMIRQLRVGLVRQVNAYNNFIGINEDASRAHNQLAWLLANTDGDYATALNAAKKSLQFDPDNSGVIDTLAHAYALGKDYDKAIENEKLAIKYAPQFTAFRTALKRFEEEKAKAEEQPQK